VPLLRRHGHNFELQHGLRFLPVACAQAVRTGIAAADDHHALAGGQNLIGNGIARDHFILLRQKLHREIMLTAVYALSDEPSERNFAEDPDNRMLWRYNRRRLDAEALRDSILYVSGKLDLTAGGPPVRLAKENNRRTVYAYISRRQLDPMLALFDFPNPNNTSEQRLQTTVPLQKLFFMNSPFVMDQSAALAARVAATASGDDQRIAATYRLVLQRDPTPEERKLAREFVAGNAGAWPQFTQVLLSSNEFTYLN